MLETRELCKVYKPKKGVPVTALNKVSLKFPDTGMVFLLGKSGSGKSTLLNLLGGLDKYDDGEIIIKGVSSKDFKQQHFDSYRNTYVGFIFQEYNVLEEFSVGANIALALELQGKKAADEEINTILQEVDLEGYGNRKPNELSGGQKQRVAIARALVKSPEIIMADEPTGALDSNTGRQVFDTLKKLSKDKLVIVVSHDREFSEQYADRIIELADGSVISDVELDASVETIAVKEENLKFINNTVEVAAGYHLTEEDRIAINNYIDKMSNDNVLLKIGIDKVTNKRFIQTNQDKIKPQDGKNFRLIKSKLPLKNAVKIGASGLKHKKFRLVMTILLSFIAFGLFGLADTLGSYNHVKTCANSLIDSNVDYVSVAKSIKMGEGIDEYYNRYGHYLSEQDIKEIESNVGTDFTEVYVPKGTSLEFYHHVDADTEFDEGAFNLYAFDFSGFGEMSKEGLEKYGYEVLAGNLPDGTKNEIAISKYMYESFHKGGYATDDTYENGKQVYEKINSYMDLIGKTLNIANEDYTITAIIDTKLDLDRYASLGEDDEYLSNTEQLARYALMNEFYYCTNYSFAKVAMVGEGHLEKIIENSPKMYDLSTTWIYMYSDTGWLDPMYITNLENISEEKIYWVDGEKTELGEKELVVSANMLYNFYWEEIDFDNETFWNDVRDFSFDADIYSQDTYEQIYESDFKIVGILEDSEYKYASTIVTSNKYFDMCVTDKDGKYSFAIGNMPESSDEIENMVSFCYREDNDVRYELQDAVSYELDIINEGLKIMSKVFLYVGIGFAVFASLMLANFIGTSISYKKQEIGILRAIGSRSNDVFRIFFSESLIIAMINFVLSTVAVFFATNLINSLIRNEIGILITVLHCGIRQVALLFGVSVVVALLASFLPVRKIASKRPIDAIRNR